MCRDRQIVLKCAETDQLNVTLCQSVQRQTDCVKMCRDRSAQGNIVLKYAERDRLC